MWENLGSKTYLVLSFLRYLEESMKTSPDLKTKESELLPVPSIYRSLGDSRVGAETLGTAEVGVQGAD